MRIPLHWENTTEPHPEREPWSDALIAAIEDHFADLEAGNPEGFLAGYDALDHEGRLRYWGELFVAISFYESWTKERGDWDPLCDYKEGASVNNNVSRGLLQISTEDADEYPGLPIDRWDKFSGLHNPIVNLHCGVFIFAKLVNQDGAISECVTDGTGRVHWQGAARYWSTIRAGEDHHREDIRARVRKYAGIPTP